MNTDKEAQIDCAKCVEASQCCRMGAWVDLEEAKEILNLGLKGEFYHLEKDVEFPSGYKVGTSYEEDPCSFLTEEGLCSIHKLDYKFKPSYCKEFPYENGQLAEFTDILCPQAKKNSVGPELTL